SLDSISPTGAGASAIFVVAPQALSAPRPSTPKPARADRREMVGTCDFGASTLIGKRSLIGEHRHCVFVPRQRDDLTVAEQACPRGRDAGEALVVRAGTDPVLDDIAEEGGGDGGARARGRRLPPSGLGFRDPHP